jgi:hypothetical protein
MIKVDILYPNEDGKSFYMDFDEKTPLPMMANFLGSEISYLSK